MIAIKLENKEVVELLIEKESSTIDLADKDGKTPIYIASRKWS